MAAKGSGEALADWEGLLDMGKSKNYSLEANKLNANVD
jgi:hypothetical protein